MINSMIAKSKNSITQKPISFIAPGQLKKTSNISYGSKRIAIVEERTNDLCNHGTTGGNPVHNLFLHFGEVKWEERNITEESSFLDLLTLCKRFIDIYSVGFKITDGDGRPLRNDKDFLCMLKEHEDVENISVYLDVDETLQPLLFKLPEDNPSFGGMKRKHFNDTQAAQIKELRAKLNGKEEENNDLRRRVEEIESWVTQMKNENRPNSDEPPVCGVDLN